MADLLFHPAETAAGKLFLVFRVGAWRMALPLPDVERVLPVMDALPLPGAPSAVVGVVRIRNRAVPVVDLRRCLGSPAKQVDAADALLVVRTPLRQLALWADQVDGLASIPEEELVEASPLLGENRLVRAVASQRDALILVYNLEEILSAEDEAALAAALRSLEEAE